LPTSPDLATATAPAAPTAALELDAVAVSYGDTVAIEGLTAHVQAGSSVALVGPNGAGKSTLIRAILGIVPVAAGRIRVLGTDPVSARRRVAYVPQHTDLDSEFPVTARQVVLMGRYRHVGWLRRPGRADRAAAASAIHAVGLDDVADHRFGTLSGGQRQRVLFARALAQEADVLLLDEPFNGVDLTTQQLMIDLLAAARSRGAVVVLSTHDLDLARHTCEEACLLNRRLFAFGPVAQALDEDLLLAAFAHAPHVLAPSAVVATTITTEG